MRRCALLPLLRSFVASQFASGSHTARVEALAAAAADAASQRRAASSDASLGATAGGGGWAASALGRASRSMSTANSITWT
jgi:hypothetical protein